MSARKFSKPAVFAGFFQFFESAFSKRTKSHKLPYLGKRSSYIWGAICLSVAISYNSCGVQYTQVANAQNMLEKPSNKIEQKTPPIDNRKVIYLTFDDGPNKGTSKVMQVLEKHGLPATFFLVGEHIYDTPWQKALYENLLQSPHYEVANHTFSHAKNRYNHFYLHPELVLADFQRMQDSLQLHTSIGRTPGMDVWRTSEIKYDVCKRSSKAADMVQANGFTLIGWDVEWKASGKRQLKKTAGAVASEIAQAFAERLTHTDDHLVLLLHDQHYMDSSNVQALENLVVALKQTGEYRFEKVSGYPCL